MTRASDVFVQQIDILLLMHVNARRKKKTTNTFPGIFSFSTNSFSFICFILLTKRCHTTHEIKMLNEKSSMYTFRIYTYAALQKFGLTRKSYGAMYLFRFVSHFDGSSLNSELPLSRPTFLWVADMKIGKFHPDALK